MVCSHDAAADSSPFSGREFVDLLQRSNLFTIPLDAHGQWFRYHNLFQELLQRQLKERASGDEIAQLNLRTSEWFESQGLIAEAIHYALAVGDVPRAADIVERHRHDEFNADRWYVVERWLAMLPAEVKRQRPSLLLADGWVAYCRLQLDRIPLLIEQCESAVGDRPLETSLAAEFAFFRGSLEYWTGHAEESRQLLEEALSKIGDSGGYIESETELALGLARCMAGDTELAVRALEDRVRGHIEQEGVFFAKIIGGLGLIRLVSGDLVNAIPNAKQMRLAAVKNRIRNHEAWSDYFEGCAHLHANELEAASQHFARAAEQRYIFETRAALDALSGLVLSQQLLEEPDKARETAGRLRQFAAELNDPEALAVADSCAARLSVLRGDSASAESWARSFRGEPDPGAFFMWLETPLITRARVLIAAGTKISLRTAADSLRSLRQHCQEWRFTCQTIEIAVLLALALEKQGKADESMVALREAVELALPGGWVRPFVEAGPVMAGMLQRLDPEGGDRDFIRRVLAACEAGGAGDSKMPPPVQPTEPTPAREARPDSPADQPPFDTLTDRELDILELLHQRLYNKEIAAKLCISTHTVNYHLKNVYSKLGVTSRRQAVNRALEMGILRTTV